MSLSHFQNLILAYQLPSTNSNAKGPFESCHSIHSISRFQFNRLSKSLITLWWLAIRESRAVPPSHGRPSVSWACDMISHATNMPPMWADVNHSSSARNQPKGSGIRMHSSWHPSFAMQTDAQAGFVQNLSVSESRTTSTLSSVSPAAEALVCDGCAMYPSSWPLCSKSWQTGCWIGNSKYFSKNFFILLRCIGVA